MGKPAEDRCLKAVPSSCVVLATEMLKDLLFVSATPTLCRYLRSETVLLRYDLRSSDVKIVGSDIFAYPS